MNGKELQERLDSIQQQLANFAQNAVDSEQQYQRLMKETDDPRAQSVLMEHHLINVERQRESMTRLVLLRDHVQQQLARLNGSH